MFTRETGSFKYRIVIPVFENREIVSFTSRAIFVNTSPRYKSAPNDKCIKPLRDCLYNIDNALETTLIVEGPTDVWRFGIGTVALFGKTMSEGQIKLLLSKGVKDVFVMLDPGAWTECCSLTNKLNNLFRKATGIFLDTQDPAELPAGKVSMIKRMIWR